jgi:hypothetical protein
VLDSRTPTTVAPPEVALQAIQSLIRTGDKP